LKSLPSLFIFIAENRTYKQITMHRFILSLLLVSTLTSKAQEIKNDSPLKLREIMRGDDFIGHQPTHIRWDKNGNSILFEWNPENNPGNSEYVYNLKRKTIVKKNKSFYETNSDYHKDSYYSEHGNLIHFNNKVKQSIISLHDDIYNVQEYDEIVYFQLKTDLYRYHKSKGEIKQLVAFSKQKEASKKTPSKMEEEELALFQFHTDQKEAANWRDNEPKFHQKIKTIYHPQGSVSNIQGTPDGKFILFRVNEYPEVKNTHVEHHISKNGHSYLKNARSKVSDKDPDHKLGIYNLISDSVYYVDFSSLKNIKKKPEYLRLYKDFTAGEYASNRKLIMHQVKFSADGKKNVMDIRSYDNKDRWIVSINFTTGEIQTFEHQHDEAWIGGPGISSWNMVQGVLGWLTDNETIYFQSEETGYAHLYLYNTSRKQKEALTSGEWEVHNVELSSNGSKFYIHANKTHPGNRNFYHLNLKSKQLIPILEDDGNYTVTISPDEKMLAIRYSYKNKPWELYIAPNKENATLNQITHSTTSAFKNYNWYDPAIKTFTATDGNLLHARVYVPDSAKQNGSAIIFVHGAGYLQNAHNFWSGYHREYMFHNMLRDNGFTVLDIDYRASKGYGRDHRTAIYRHMGGLDLSDQLDGKQYLIDSLNIDSKRIGIYGGSYGGFITLMALLTAPGEFKAGAALRSVTDWMHYNHEYTSNILNYPGTDPEAYKKSSPIYFAENLTDRLLMLHGMVDDNVQFQDVVRLSQRFIELEKTNWELALFPVEAHGFKKSSSWNDEYRRIYTLFYEELILNK